MPVSLTKNKMNEEELQQIIAHAFSEREVQSVTELTEGFFNVAYEVTFADGEAMILKIAPPPASEIMTHEINIMFSEVESMRMAAHYPEIPVADVVYYDNSHTLCNSDYFFMKKLEGKSLSSCSEELSDSQNEDIQKKIGEITACLNRIKGERFGYYGQPEKQGEDWYTVFRSILADTFADAKRKGIDLKIEKERLFALLEQQKCAFTEVIKPSFVHWDLWAGNVFVKREQVTGIIDFERCLWGDPLMEVGFRTYDLKSSFLEGYGIEEFTENQKIRSKWYDIYLFLIWSLECDYRQYDSRDLYHYGTTMLNNWLNQIEAELKGGAEGV